MHHGKVVRLHGVLTDQSLNYMCVCWIVGMRNSFSMRDGRPHSSCVPCRTCAYPLCEPAQNLDMILHSGIRHQNIDNHTFLQLDSQVGSRLYGVLELLACKVIPSVLRWKEVWIEAHQSETAMRTWYAKMPRKLWLPRPSGYLANRTHDSSASGLHELELFGQRCAWEKTNS